jgi:hypothetical protein
MIAEMPAWITGYTGLAKFAGTGAIRFQMPGVRRTNEMVERAAFVCEHVFDASRPVLLVSHEAGDWQFLCGGEDHGSWETARVVGINHLFDRDASLLGLVDLPVGGEAERPQVGGPWVRRRSE